MLEKNYEKPRAKFISIRSSEKVADTCWGLEPGHPNDVAHYYDVEGPGYVSFHVQSGSGNCANPDAYNILYYEYEGAEGVPADRYNDEIEAALRTAGGNNGQPYRGFDVHFPVKPDPEWS